MKTAGAEKRGQGGDFPKDSSVVVFVVPQIYVYIQCCELWKGSIKIVKNMKSLMVSEKIRATVYLK